MKPETFTADAPGQVVRVGHYPVDYWAYVPGRLPPPLDLGAFAGLLEEASFAVGDLKGAGSLLPNPHLLIQPFVRREAVLSSRIEGTQASMSDLLFFEAAPEAPPKVADVREVMNYVRALETGLEWIKQGPLSLFAIRQIHQVLMDGVRGQHATPGSFRTTQNWIGPPGCTLNEATYVPPPVDQMQLCLLEWERFLAEKNLPVLIQVAILHYHFEAIHPFIDGNGRVGRLMVTLFLAERGVLPQPLLYLSAFFERHRDAYYDNLLSVSTTGAWESWISFFLRGVRGQAKEAVTRTRALLDLKQAYLEMAARHKKAAATSSRLVEALFQRPVTTARLLEDELGISYPAAQSAIDRLVEAGVLREVTGQQRGRIYAADEIRRVAMEDLPESEHL